MTRAKWVDIHTTAPCVASKNGERGGLAALPHVHVNPLHALLVEFIVIAKAHDVFQQTSLIDLRATVVNLHAAPIGLIRDQAIAFEQVAHQRFSHGLLVEA